jgi:hypothetical protein
MFTKKPFIKFEDLYPRSNYGKKNKNNKNNKVSFTGFIISIDNFIYIILNGFI